MLCCVYTSTNMDVQCVQTSRLWLCWSSTVFHLSVCLTLLSAVSAQTPPSNTDRGGALPDISFSQPGINNGLAINGQPLDSFFPDVPGRGGGMPMDSHVTCPMRNKCQADGRDRLLYRDINCFCDPLCQVYDDCCKDHDRVVAPIGNSRARISNKMFDCMRLMNYDLEVEVYMVNSCPKKYADPEVNRQCEYTPGHDLDFFYELPVSGVQSKVLYKNYYCALCAGEEHLHFWSVDIECDHPPEGNVTSDPASYMNKIIQESSATWYGCHKKLSNPTIPPRKCKSAHSKCLKTANRKLKKKCKKETAYVYAGKEVFKNKYCAQCNNVNDTYLSCEDTRTPSGSPDFPQHFSAFSLTIDMNKRRAAIQDLREGVSGERQVTIQFDDILECEANHVYDPFAKQCRLLNCPPNSHLQNGHCVIDSTNTNPTQTPRSPEPNGGGPTFERIPIEGIPGDVGLPDLPPSIDLNPQPYPYPTQQSSGGDHHNSKCNRTKLSHTEYKMFLDGSVLVYALNKTYGLMDYELGDDSFLYICAPPPSHKVKKVRPTGPKSKVKPSVAPNTTNQHTMFMFQFDRMQDLVSFVSVLVSLVALLIMFIVYLMLPPLRNIPGQNIMCLVFCLFVAQSLFLVTVHLPSFNMFEVCLGLAAAMHYFWLAAFFWMNVLAFDVWRIFVYRANNNSGDRGGCCRFTAYSFYAWFMPAGIIAAALVLDFKLFEGVDDIYLPHYGKEGSCWIVQKYALLFLFALPLAILLLTNIVFFFAAIINVCRIARMAEVANRGKDRCRLIIYIKLSLVMGMTWVFAFLALLLKMEVFWYLFIGFNAFQGVFICFAFTLNKKVFKLLSSKGRVSNRRQQSSDVRACSNGLRSSGPGHSGGTGSRSYFSDSSAKVIAQETSI